MKIFFRNFQYNVPQETLFMNHDKNPQIYLYIFNTLTYN